MSEHYEEPDNPLLDKIIDLQQRKIIKEKAEIVTFADYIAAHMKNGSMDQPEMDRMAFWTSGKSAKEFFPGPWQDEEDMKEFWIEAPTLLRTKQNKNWRIDRKWVERYGFTSAPAKFHCLIYRMKDFGNLNGYVGIPAGHIYFFTHMLSKLTKYDVDMYGPDFRVHGGVTYSGWGGHTPAPMKRHLYYIGFDTSHAGDLVPGLQIPGIRGNKYRDMTYVEKEVHSLATQVINLGMEERCHNLTLHL